MPKSVQCKHCAQIIPLETNYKYTPCSCDKIAVDGGKEYSRIIGNSEDYLELPFAP